MLLENYFPQEDLRYKTFLFGPNISSNTTSGIAYPLTLPQCNFVYIRVLAGGGSGAGGIIALNGTGANGGGGGGSSSITSLLIPRILFPDVIYISVGIGGSQVASGTNGNNGQNTYVTVRPIIPGSTPSGADTICYANAGQGGLSAGTGGTAGAIATSANMLWGCMHAIGGYTIANLSIAGQSGAAGGASSGANGSSISYPTTGLCVSGGAGGGGKGTGNTLFSGGNITGISSSYVPTILGGGTSTVQWGNSGVSSLGRIDLSRTQLFNISTSLIKGCGEATGTGAGTGNLINGWVNTGGAGGTANGTASSFGGAGGVGGFGSGGGGGGAATIVASAGSYGGPGGPGICMIVCF